MKIITLSDTHGHFVKDDLTCDILIHAGDATGSGKPHLIEAFLEWFSKQPAKHKIYVPGNHDLDVERFPTLWKEKAKSLGIELLIDETIVIEGLVVHGSPATPMFHNWAFMYERGERIARKWQLIPEYCDILITHGPPQGILDKCAGGNVGCEELFKRVLEVKPQLHIFGHIHEDHGFKNFNGTSFYNVSIMDGDYRPVHSVTHIEL